MKKQILSLMACAAFFAETPAFCMDLEETPEEKRGTLSFQPKEVNSEVSVFHQFNQFTPELQSQILNGLYETKDIGCLKCVSRDFGRFLENRKKFTLYVQYINQIHTNRENYNNPEFSLFLGDENRNVLLHKVSMVAQYNANLSCNFAQETLTIFSLSGETIKFPATFQLPLFFQNYCNGFAITEFPYRKSEKVLKKSELIQNDTLVATIVAVSNDITPMQVNLSLRVEEPSLMLPGVFQD